MTDTYLDAQPPEAVLRVNSPASIYCRLKYAVVLVIALIAYCCPVAAETVSLSSVSNLNIDADHISVSGVSSGAFMAHQFHVIHSRRINGVGIIAGGPYRCAAQRRFLSYFDITGLYVATSVCSDTNPFWFFQGPPDAGFSVDETNRQVALGAIDDPRYMRNDKVWLFTGGADRAIPTPVMETVHAYYQVFVSKENIAYKQHPEANHAMITNDFGNSCDAFEPPYINDCDFDAAELMFRHFYGELNPPVVDTELQPVVEFDQQEFFDPGDKSVSMNKLGHAYVPRDCAAGNSCRLHVAFHGCGQNQEQIGDAFFANAAYNHWAETNRIVVLYPQTAVWSESFFFNYNENPNGCWDWWGYSGEDYATAEGKQIKAVGAMIRTLVGRSLFAPAQSNADRELPEDK